jgi:hypothetical protein
MGSADRLIARKRCEKKRIIRIEEKDIAHQVVRDHSADRTRTRTVARHELAVENLYHICYRHLYTSLFQR